MPGRSAPSIPSKYPKASYSLCPWLYAIRIGGMGAGWFHTRLSFRSYANSFPGAAKLEGDCRKSLGLFQSRCSTNSSGTRIGANTAEHATFLGRLPDAAEKERLALRCGDRLRPPDQRLAGK